MSQSATAITPQDFSQRMTDVHRYRWTPGKMRHVIAALKGQKVAIVTDTSTGSTLIGVRLIGLTETISSGDCVILQGEGEAWPRPVAYRLLNCGIVIPLEESVSTRGAKWDALDTWRNEKSAAIQAAKRAHPECDYGNWEATPGRTGVSWRYEPLYHTGSNEAFAPFDPETRKMTWGNSKPRFAYGTYRLAELAEETNYKGEPVALATI